MSRRVAVLLDHQSAIDTRVYRAAHALADAGYTTRIFAAGAEVGDLESIAPNLTRQRVRVSLWRRQPRAKRPPHGAEPRNSAPDRAGNNATTTAVPSAKAPASATQGLAHRIKSVVSNALHFHAYSSSFADAVCDFSPDIIHANDLNTLPAGARLASRCGAKLIYDAHEYEADRNHAKPLPTWVALYRRATERNFAPRATMAIAVSDGIADLMRDHLGIARPHVILNTPDIEEAKRVSEPIQRIPERLLHVGLLRPGRYQEICIEALCYLPDHHLRFVGPQLPGFQEVLERKAAGLGVEARVQFVGALPIEALYHELQQAFASLVLMPAHNLSCELALPNKLFESLAAGTPVVASDRTEIRKIVMELQCGTLLHDHSAVGLASAVRQLARAPIAPFTLPRRFGFAAQKEKLLKIYDQLC